MSHSAPPEDLSRPRRELLLALALALLAGLPYLVVTHPQLTDYPSHLARYHVMLDRATHPFLRQYYDFEWILAGNLGADLLMLPLGKLFGANFAAWLIGLLIPVLTALGLITVAWTLRRRIGIGPLLAFSTIWSPAMAMGFYNFCLSLALALFAFVAWVRLEGKRWRWAVMVAIGLVVWLCHASGWGVLGVLVFGYEWHRRKSLASIVAPWPLAIPLVPMLLLEGAKGSLNYGSSLVNYKLGIWIKALRDQSFELDFLATVGIAIAIIAALVLRKIDGRLGWSALIIAVLTIVMPRHFGGGDFADLRLVSVALMLGALAIDWQTSRLMMTVVATLFVVRLGVTTVAWHDADRRLDAALGALSVMPHGARVVGAVAVDLRRWEIDPFEHAPSYATVYRDALVNSHFAVPRVHMLQVRGLGSTFADPSHRIFIRDDSPVDLAGFVPLRHADYVWYFGPTDGLRLPGGARVLHRAPDAVFARLAKPDDAR